MADILSQREIDALLDVVEDIVVPFVVLIQRDERYDIFKYDEALVEKEKINGQGDRQSLKNRLSVIHDADYDNIEIHASMVTLGLAFKSRLNTLETNRNKWIKQWLEYHPEYNL